MKYLVALLLLVAVPAHAQVARCFATETVVKRLAEAHEEKPMYRGVGGEGALMVIYASEKTGTFTVAIENPPGVSCIVFSGEGWETITPAIESH